MAISQAASEVGAPPIQNIGTLGGNLLQNSRCLFYNQSELVRSAAKPCLKVGGQLCHAVKSSKKCFSVYQGDTAPALLCFGATVKLQKKDSSRTCALAELFTGSGESPFSITKDELLTEVRVPLPPAGSRSSFKKLRLRGSLDYPLASAAVLLSFGNGSISDASVAIGACGPAPVSVSAVTEALRGNSTGEADVSGAGELAAKLFRAADNLGVPGSYRRKMIKVMTARALREAIDQSGKEGS
jgi:CO/xanthine dehydrogenase FAD-binding subunit